MPRLGPAREALSLRALQKAYQTSTWSRTTILSQITQKLAENVNASERKIELEKPGAATKISYFWLFVPNLRLERRLLRM
jgi:hypothetical protein